MHLHPILAAAAVVSILAGTATAVLADRDRLHDGPKQDPAIPLRVEQTGRPSAPACADPAPVGIAFSSGMVHVPNHGEVSALIVEATVTNHGPGAVSVSSTSHDARLHFHWGDQAPIEVASLSLAGLGVGERQVFTAAVPMDAYQWRHAVHGAPRVTLSIDAEPVDCDTAGAVNITGEYGPAPTAM